MIERQEIAVEDLRLDVLNPRIPPQTTQRGAIRALLDDVKGAEKLTKLGTSIAENGLSPIDDFMVTRADGSSSAYVVLEGNRRIACLKLLQNPDLAGDHPARKAFEKLAAEDPDLPRTVVCAIAESREEAKPWLELRHTGESGGEGVLPWSAEARRRFASGRSGHREWGLRVAEAVAPVYTNATLLRDVATVRRERLTTLGRLFEDRYVQTRLAYRRDPEDDDALLWHYSAESLEPLFARIFGDLADGTISVSDLKSKLQRRAYIDGLDVLPHPSEYRETAARLTKPRSKDGKGGAGGTSGGSAKGTGDTSTSGSGGDSSGGTGAGKPPGLLVGVALPHMSAKTRGVLKELQKLSPDAYPHATAVLLRVLVELAVFEAYINKHGKAPKDLGAGLKWCLPQIDPSGRDNTYQGVRAGLSDGTSVLATATLHAYLHNVHFHATPTDVRSFASNYGAFLKAVDKLLA